MLLAVTGTYAGAATSSNVVASLDSAEVSLSDIDGVLINKSPTDRQRLLNDPKAVGQMLTDILVRRSIVAREPSLLDVSELAAIRKQARQDELAKLGMRYILENDLSDDVSTVMEANRLYQEEINRRPPTYRYTFAVVASLVEDDNWDEAREGAKSARNAAVSGASVDSLIEDFGVHVESFEALELPQLATRMRQLIKATPPGETSPVDIDSGSAFFVQVFDKSEIPPKSFSEVRGEWLAKARGALRSQRVQEILEQRSAADVAKEFAETGLIDDPTIVAALRLAEEEAILKAIKRRVFEMNIPSNLEPIASERYVTNRAAYSSVAKADIVSYHVAGADMESVGEFAQRLESVYADSGIDGLDAFLDKESGFAIVKRQVGDYAPTNLLDPWQEEAFSQALGNGGKIGVVQRQSAWVIVVVKDYLPSVQRPFEEIKGQIVAEVRAELEKLQWESFKEPYYSLTLDANREVIAAISSHTVRDPIKDAASGNGP